MIWVRKGFTHFLSIILFLSLIGSVTLLGLNKVVGQPENVKKIVADSGIYEQLIDGSLKQAQEDGAKKGSDTSVSLNDAQVQQAAKQAFSPQLLRQNVEAFIDANYAWLKGQTAKPSFNVDLTAAKTDFATQVGNAVSEHLQSLSVCTPEQMAQLELPVNPLTVNCRPSSLDPQTEGARITQEIKDNDEFLKESNITPENLKDEQKPDQKPYYESLAKAPKIYQLGQKGPWLLALLALLTAISILFTAISRRRGWRRVGVVLILASLVLIISKFAADTGINKLSDSLRSGVASQLKGPMDNLARQVEAQLFQYHLLLGIILLVLGIAIVIWLIRTREGQAKPSKPAAPGADDKDDEPLLPEPTSTVAPSRPPIKSADQAPKIKKPRPPRLIQ